MTMSDPTLLVPIDKKARLRRLIWFVVIAVVALHVIAGLIAGALVVARYFMKPEATFEATRDVRMPAKEREQRMNMAEFDSLAPKPSFNDKLQSLKPAKFSLPELPKIPVDEMLPLDPSAIVTDQVSSMIGAAGTGSGAGDGGSGSGGTGGSGMSFFGIKDSGKSVVIVVDTSNSMFERSRKGVMHHFNFKTIKDQTTQLIDKLSINTRFNVVVYEGGSMAFSNANVPATDANKAAAREWVQGLEEDPDVSIGRRSGGGPKLMEGGGTRLDTAMRQTFKFQPEIIYIITDGEINRGGGSYGGNRDNDDRGGNRRNDTDANKIGEREMVQIIEDLQKTLPQPARIHTLMYQTSVVRPEEVQTLRAIARRNSGKFRQVKAEETRD